MNGWIRNYFMDEVISLLRKTTLALGAALATFGVAAANEAQWVWSPDHAKANVPTGEACHFRKVMTLRGPESGQVAIASDDQYELYVNGRRIGAGESTKKLDEYDISKNLVKGPNVIAVRVQNTTGTTAALVARVTIKDQNEWISFSTDGSWRTSLRPLPLWNTAMYNDRAWLPAQAFGTLGSTAPWDRRENVPAEQVSKSERFKIDPQFEVQYVLGEEQTGSIIAMTFNEFGHILASKEGGGLLLIYDANGDKIPERVRTYCDKVKNIQGILALNGEVYVTGEGEDGLGLYRLADKDRDGVLESVRTLVKFKSEVVEHGPHGIVLGPDGLLYVMLGNHTSLVGTYESGSPHRDFYDTDLVPKYEDPGGHAAGIKAPGGVVIRTDTEGSGVQLVAGGLRNPYDLVFNREGELFIHDADMESDEGTTWYRPTRVCHVVPGGEYGWRSGWSKWPDYYADSLPAVVETGRGSPAGMTTYNHFMFPVRFHGALFTADWSQGKILAIKLKRSGASYTATTETFLEGNPLNVTDLEVGPDGWLYFSTGGRGTSGGIYRVTWKGTVPKDVTDTGTGLTAVIRQPQPSSSWARQNIAALRKQLSANWDKSITGVARTAANPPHYRLQALDLMQLYGPTPTTELLLELSKEASEVVRCRAAELMGLHASKQTHQRLIEMLDDSERSVRRKACEALGRADQAPPLDKVLTLLASDDRFEAWAARRILERMPVEDWRERVLQAKNQRLLVQGGLALMISHPTRENALAVLEQVSRTMSSFVSDRDFLDITRLVQVTLARGKIVGDDIPALKRQLADEFPSGDSLMNRELIRVLACLQEDTLIDRYLAYLKSDAPELDRLHAAMYLRFVNDGWTPDQRIDLLAFYEEANKRKGGGSYARYIINVTRDFCQQLNEEESRLVLAQGHKWPNAALGALYKLPKEIDEPTLELLTTLDARLAGTKSDPVQRLQVGIVAVLARSGDDASMAYLRKVYDESPDRRQAAVLGLSQRPDGENWNYLIKSLPLLEPAAAREVCAKLTDVDQPPSEPESIRQVILLGLKMRKKDPEKENAAENALGLLHYWTGEEIATSEDEDKQLVAWQKWFVEKFPAALEPKLPVVADNAKYTVEELVEYLGGEADGVPTRGGDVFVKANCVKCHRFDGKGESLGPDLTTISNRFTRKELVEAVVHPSHIISSQYASKTIKTTDGRTLTGLVGAGTAGETVIILPTAERVTLKSNQIEATKPSKLSAMPDGLLDPLSLEEIADLFAYLQKTSKTPSLTRRPVDATAK
ncbi:MAG TPA: HEAT repeat domain-containing protein [Pirellulaceae bacterium]|jgi:putative heme-binding domain-containing protein